MVGGGGLDRLYAELPGGEIPALAHVAGGVHVRVAALQAVVHQHAKVGLDAAAFEKTGIGPNARGGNHHVGAQPLAIIQFYRQPAGILFNRLDPGGGQHVDALVQAPLFYKVPGGLVHHARHHAVFHFDHRQVHAALGQSLQDDAADESRTHQDYIGAFACVLRDVPAVLKGPAGMDAG